jgi:hypothetical protein
MRRSSPPLAHVRQHEQIRTGEKHQSEYGHGREAQLVVVLPLYNGNAIDDDVQRERYGQPAVSLPKPCVPVHLNLPCSDAPGRQRRRVPNTMSDAPELALGHYQHSIILRGAGPVGGPQGLKAQSFWLISARLKSCPDKKRIAQRAKKGALGVTGKMLSLCGKLGSASRYLCTGQPRFLET